MSPCENCTRPENIKDREKKPAPGVYFVWVRGCPLKKIRFGTLAEVAAGEGKMPDKCDQQDKIDKGKP